MILDPATGTGTFLREIILRIYENFKNKNKNLSHDELKKKWNAYVPKHLLPRVSGFELMMAPYAVAHMKLAMVLKDTGYDFNSNERLRVYLTNTLEEPSSDDKYPLWDDPLALEALAANQVKKNEGINIVIGNPPYSGVSSNNNQWIQTLINDYKYKDKEYFNERKHWLNDDYVKFIRYAERIIEHCDNGIVAYISNNGFLDNPTFRFMRYHILETFDDVYILNLHGNSKKREIAPDGSKDENVFDIMQGVSIELFVKNQKNNKNGNLANVYYKDLYGGREHKYEFLNASDIEKWEATEILPPFYPFSASDPNTDSKYNTGFSPLDVFMVTSTGYLSGKDKVFVANSSDDLITNLINTYGDKVERDLIKKIIYRPFDEKVALFAPRKSLISPKITLPACYRTRYEVMKHFYYENYALLIGRQGVAVGDVEWNLSFFVDKIPDLNIFYRGGENVFPLYLYDGFSGDKSKRLANIKDSFLKDFYNKTGIRLCVHDSDDGYSVLTLSDYIYAHLYSHNYRQKYKVPLKLDLPKIPYPKNEEYFISIASYGEKLRIAHLTGTKNSFGYDLNFNSDGDNMIERPFFCDGKIFINSKKWISTVLDEEWNFYIGGYQPLQKWLKDRKGLELSKEDCEHYLDMIAVIRYTNAVMREIDNVICV